MPKPELEFFPTGCASTETFVHDFWEEVYILEDSQWDGDQFFKKGMYACRPPGMKHGPYRTEEGDLRSEICPIILQPEGNQDATQQPTRRPFVIEC